MKFTRAEIQLTQHCALVNKFARNQMHDLSLPFNTPCYK